MQEMNIASITITMNDFHSLNQWKVFYDNYVSVIYRHIIVDNNSTLEYKQKLKELFPNSILIERANNGGTTGAYNDGIRYALEIPEVDAIMLLSNDIDISIQSISVIYKFLNSKSQAGAVAPVLLASDGRTVVTHGEKLKPDMGIQRLFEGKYIEESMPEVVEAECLPGGMNIVKREVYEKVGLQDESLFMYMDENDFFYRVTCSGYKLFSTKNAVASHCHIATEGKQNDNSLAWFYINRNHLFVCRKYKSIVEVLMLFSRKFFWQGIKMSFSFIRERSINKVYYYYLGLLIGMLGYKKNFVFKQ